MPQPELSIVIVSYNVRELLLRCLASVQQHTGGIAAEIIVVDNASSDGSVDAVQQRFPNVRMIANAVNGGFARANNQGFCEASGAALLMLNPDAELTDGTVGVCLRYCKAHPRTMVGSRLLNSDGSTQCCGLPFPRFWNQVAGQLLGIASRRRARPSFHRVDWVLGAFLMFPRHALEAIGYLDEGYFMYGEEKDFCYRAYQEGYQVQCYGAGRVLHHGNKSASQHETQSFMHYIQSQRRFLHKHYGRLSARALETVLLIGLARGLVFWSTIGCLRGTAHAAAKRARYLAVLRSCLDEAAVGNRE